MIGTWLTHLIGRPLVRLDFRQENVARSWATNCPTACLVMNSTADSSVIVGWLPLYHDMGLIGNVMQPLYVGGHGLLRPVRCRPVRRVRGGHPRR